MMSDFMDWLTANKGGKGSGNFGHSGRPGQAGGSGHGKTGEGSPNKPGGGVAEGSVHYHLDKTAEDPENKQNMIRSVTENAPEIIEKMRAGGFSFRPTKGFKNIYEDTGYMVALQKFESPNFDRGTFGTRDLIKFVAQHYRMLKKTPGLHIGGWTDKDTGVSVLDLSVHVENRKEAEALGNKNKQKAIFDLKEGRDIDLNADEGRLASKKEVQDMGRTPKTKTKEPGVVRVLSTIGHPDNTLDQDVEELKEMAAAMGLVVTPEDEAFFRAEIQKQIDAENEPGAGK